MPGYGEGDQPVDDAPAAGGYGADDRAVDAPAPSTGVGRKVADTALSLAKGVVGVPQAAVGLADLVTGGQAGKAVENLGVRFKDAQDMLGDLQSEGYKDKQRQFQEADGILDKAGVALTNPSLIVNTVA